jgi:hypothetical protein
MFSFKLTTLSDDLLIHYNAERVFVKETNKGCSVLIEAEGASLSAGVPGSLLGAFAPPGSPLPRTPAGVFAPSAPIKKILNPYWL